MSFDKKPKNEDEDFLKFIEKISPDFKPSPYHKELVKMLDSKSNYSFVLLSGRRSIGKNLFQKYIKDLKNKN